VRRITVFVLALALAALPGCGGNSAIKQSLAWRKPPSEFTSPGSKRHTVAGIVKNTTSHTVNLDVRNMRLLDDQGRKVKGRIQIRRARLPAGGTTPLVATWKAGKPVRIDYGAGTLALTSP
jgi:hypothetical protein